MSGAQYTYSVLMSVYAREQPEYLWQSMESILAQTVPTDDFVLICDGPLTKEVNEVIAQMQTKFGPVLRVIRLEQNGGLGHALRIGVSLCKNELIARMDSDDISRPDRCAKQLAAFLEHPDVSVIGGIIDEFVDSPEQLVSRRIVPQTNGEIYEFAKKRSPFNHVTVMYKKSDVLAAGNYRTDVYCMEDYYLWVTMLLKGYKGYNLQESLVWVRSDTGQFKRRAGKAYIKQQNSLFRFMRDERYINTPQYYLAVFLRTCSGIAPTWVRKLAYRSILRKE